MPKRLVMALTGFPGTGKTTAAAYLSERHGFNVFEGSTLLRQTAAAQGITLSAREAYEDFMRSQQAEKGLSWLADTVLRQDGDRLLQCGLRSRYDLRRIKQAGGAIVALSCLPEICIARMDQNDPKNPKTIKEYLQHQQLEESPDERGSHTQWSAWNADYVIETSFGPEHTQRELDTIVALMIAKS